MNFKEVKAHNFRHYQDMELSLDNQGLVLVNGNNLEKGEGSTNAVGKTSIYFAILYSLYGELPDHAKGDDVINNKVGKDCFTHVSFDKDNHLYKITRYRKDKKYKNKVILEVDGKDITKATNKDTDEEIINILGFNMETMLSSLVFSPERVDAFIDATDKQRKELLEQLTNTQIYKEALILVREDIKDISNKISESVKDKDHLSELQSSHDSIKETWELAKQQYSSSIKNLTYKSEQLSKLILEKPKLDELKKDVSKLAKEIQDQSDDSSLSLIDDSKLQETSRKVNQAIYKITNRVKQLNQQVATNQDNYKKIELGEVTTCVVCGSPLNEEHKAKELSSLATSIKEDILELDTLGKKKNQIDAINKENQAKLVKVNEDNKHIKDIYQSRIGEINKLQSFYRDKQQKLSDNNNIMLQYNQVMKELSDKKSNVLKEPEGLNDNYVDKIEELTNKISSLKDKLKDLKKLEDIYSDQGVKSEALGLAIPYLNEKLKEYMNILSEGTLNAQITSKSETKSGNTNNKLNIIIDSTGSSNNYKDLSSGEKRRIAIALHLSFMSYLKSNYGDINLLVFDEVFDALDTNGIESVILLLKSLVPDGGTTLVISHSSDLKYNDSFDQTLEVIKDSNKSYIKREK